MKVRWGLVAIVGLVCVIAVIIAHLGSGVWQQSRFSQSESWQVVRVSDGDTIKVQSGGRRETIRLCGIDAPEVAHGRNLGQPFGKEAREKLRSLLASANNQVMVVSVEKDRYGRTVGEVFVKAPTREQPEQERFINYEMVASGMAYEYTRYSGSCPNREAIAQAERLAQSKHLGVWAGNYQRPWDYRKQQR
ncbi:thermonuclease family protein [Kovacikia minuta CCNUW1]|uniref:thermonuclease family protein n=1 Tax=Kovacikia minuta TaxID=2931930 RepID=UPI001CCA8FEF|nr:thermonuclease family protein [Kovacikia minuta]UBF27489.1 thermonuclease family protein [Kovacikia minuta CCNUW1]